MSAQENVPCVFCQNQAAYQNALPVSEGIIWVSYFDCPNCGKYVLDEHILKTLREDTTDRPFRLACLAKELKNSGQTGIFAILPQGTAQAGDLLKHFRRIYTLDELLSQFPTATEIIDRALINLPPLVKHPMERIELHPSELQFLMFCPELHLSTQLDYMKAMGLLKIEMDTADCVRFSITPQGWQRIDALSKSSPDSRQAFVAMWFADKTDPIYRDAIARAVEKAGYKPVRIDLKEHNNKICDEIIAEIRKSRFLIADFTGQRGGVYFEAGFAMGLGIPVIWTVPKDQIDQLHFDTRQYNYIAYETVEELRDGLYNRIAATIH